LLCERNPETESRDPGITKFPIPDAGIENSIPGLQSLTVISFPVSRSLAPKIIEKIAVCRAVFYLFTHVCCKRSLILIGHFHLSQECLLFEITDIVAEAFTQNISASYGEEK